VPPLTAAELAALAGGTLHGDGSVRLSGVAPLDHAGPTDLSFLGNAKYLDEFRTSKAGAVFLTELHRDARGEPAVRIVVSDPQRAMLVAIGALYPAPPRPRGVESTAIIEPGAVLGEDCYIGHHAVIGRDARLGARAVVMAGAVVGQGASVGDDCLLHPHVVLYPGTVLGARTILHAGVCLGSDGFGYVPGKDGHAKIPHVGRVVIADDVEIGANTTIDRGSVGDTTVGRGTKIDNLVQIGHNCRIGAHCFIMGQVGLAGSTHVEDGCILAGQAGLQGHITVGRGARIGAQAGVMGDVPAGATFSGYPARPHQDAMRALSALFRLAPIIRDLEELVQRDRKE
jgi:UDP-3-O-[3-hydroxymyristoyl] glucosamine N-acyltransferase